MKVATCALAAFITVSIVSVKSASAFCGFYVAGADAKMFNDATQVVMMREGTRTVLSMRNAYKGPTENFAMVVPVPVVLQKENVKTLPDSIFDRVDSLGAPRLVEYWERDPCEPQVEYSDSARPTTAARPRKQKSGGKGGDLGVTVEAQFKVGEYEIVILSAKDSGGLEAWLKQQKYSIPAGAEPYLRPYVEAGSKFFVAKVDAQKVTFKDGRAMLSPLRFHYDSDEFSLPIRLGMMNSQGTQDLIVNILARNKRYEVANYPNVTIPTNLDVREEAKGRFGEFYAALFDRTLAKNKNAVVTEYSWDASTCDPCPQPALRPNEIYTLGGDVLTTAAPAPRVKGPGKASRPAPRRRRFHRSGFVLTRLHARYGKDGISKDLVFKEASAIAGGREWRKDGKLEESSQPSSRNMFQARYAIRHPWTGAIECKNPVRGRWGGPPSGKTQDKPVAAKDLAFVKRGAKLASLVVQDIPEIDVKAQAATSGSATKTPDTGSAGSGSGTTPGPAKKKESKGCSVADGSATGAGLFLFVALLWLRRRHRA